MQWGWDGLEGCFLKCSSGVERAAGWEGLSPCKASSAWYGSSAVRAWFGSACLLQVLSKLQAVFAGVLGCAREWGRGDLRSVQEVAACSAAGSGRDMSVRVDILFCLFCLCVDLRGMYYAAAAAVL